MAFDLDEDELRATRKMNKSDRNEIEVNDYVRTNKGNIGKVVEIRLGFNKDTQLYQKIYMLDNGLWTILEYIVNHSKQLIDLIEVGDILKIKISEEWVEKQDTIKFVVVGQTYTITEIKECLENGLFKILQILTKEQYLDNSYKVGGEYE